MTATCNPTKANRLLGSNLTFACRLTIFVLLATPAFSSALGQNSGAPATYSQPRPKFTDFSDPSAPAMRVAMQQEPIVTPPGTRAPAQAADPLTVPSSTPSSSTAVSPFDPSQIRLPLLDTNGRPFGLTPQPSAQTSKQFGQYIDRMVDPENTLDLVQGRPRLILFKEAPLRIQMADSNIATYDIIAHTQLSLTGLHVGSTIFNLWFPGAQGQEPRILSYLVRVFPDPEEKDRLERVYKALEIEINRSFPDSVVHLSLVGDKLIVAGEAKDVIEASQILRVVAANAPGNTRGRNGYETDEIPVGQVNVTLPTNALGQIPAGQNQVAQLPEQGLQNFLLRNPARNVINLLHVPGEQQVMLRVTVAEVNRTAARSIGMDFSITNNAGVTVFSQATNAAAVASGAATGGANLPTLLDNGQIALAIRALRTLSLAKSMAEPNLVTLNGQAAQFRAGGEFPVPSATQSFGGVGQGVAFVPFGVSLNFLPIITDRDRVRLQVSAVVSTRDPSLGTTVGGSSLGGGTSVSGLQTRTFTTGVELRSGQTMAVAGLIQNNFGSSATRVPLIGDLPLIGNLFGRNDTSSGDQELVILITPELVRPLETCRTPALPGNDVFEPSDIEFYLYGRLESRHTVDFRSDARTDWARLIGYEHCQGQFIIGPTGHSFNCCDQKNCPNN